MAAAQDLSVYYLQIRLAHVVCVSLSGGLFTLRGAMMAMGSPMARHWLLRWLSYAIDISLLTAALMLTSIIHQYPFVHGWLTAKVLLLLVYVVLGSLALGRAGTHRVRLCCLAAAILVFLFIISVALTHNPWGALSLLQS